MNQQNVASDKIQDPESEVQNGSLILKIRDRETDIFEGPVSSLTSYNEKGKFDVLPQHTNFISIIAKELIYRDLAGKTHEIKITNGIIRVQHNKVRIYLGIGE